MAHHTPRALGAPLAFASLLAGLVAALPSATLAAERIELARETIGSHGDTRFVTEQKMVFEDKATEAIPMETALIVEKAGREIYRVEGWRWSGMGPDLPLGTDVTGDGLPDAVFMTYSGGAHCCSTTFIFELREPTKPIVLETGDSSPEFRKLDGKPGYAIVTADGIYSYWRSSFATSPFPRVMLSYRDGAYRSDAELTRQPPLADSELQSRAAAVRNGPWQPPELPGDFLSTTLDLIYGGNLPQALKFIDLAWNPKAGNKANFVLALFQCRMPRSEFWPTIAAMNKLQPAKPRADCEKIDKNIY